ncbi:hypothetical protein PND93_10195 [Faecalicoccus pleomorphus]|uniref:Uncharacterized protein n=1 Tax=Faecalicoccus pleomorphus TaxID=1323 RepID=A0A7X9NHZ1_9FIRM|nr:DUF6557 family protein [Faecalicoccus pleomorphus]MDB7985677.1 hypothetical protein [Faecalicoccus pleomorphus]MDB7991964.1 hypothetical protein [Faecalicoccus pleomorphus]NME44628.1 hypothetical protein [Faecalicoccus pleomorphus]
MTFRELLKMHDNPKDKEYFAFVFSQYLKKRTIKKNMQSAIKQTDGLFEELLDFEKTPTHWTIGVERYLDDLEEETIQYIYDVYIMEENDPVHYAMDLIDWKELIDAPIVEESILKYGTERILVEILWEITFDGFDYQTVCKNQKKLLESLKNVNLIF